jgi:Holliday junction resolvasome RuvABC endonuclease subunit
MKEPARVIELDAEEEVDLGSAWRRIAARWWLPLAGLVLGAALGVLVSVGGGEVYRAETLIYLGQPFTPQGGGQIQTLQTNPRTVNQIIRSETALKRAAADSDLRVGQLRGNISSQAIVQVGQARSVSPLVEISVEAPAPRKAERAADALATAVIRQTSSYVDRKIELLERQNALAEEELERVDARLTTAQDQLQQILRDESIPLAERLLVSTNLNSTIGFAEQRRATVQQQLYANQQLLSLARNVEKSDIVQRASASRETATSRRNAAVIGGLIGLLLGALAAFIADPILARRNAARES